MSTFRGLILRHDWVLRRPWRESSFAICRQERVCAKRRNAIVDMESVMEQAEAYLLSEGFSRSGHIFHRRRFTGDINAKIGGISFRFEYGFRTCWLLATVKFPHLIELLTEVRPFAYKTELAWRVPDYGSHLSCMLRLVDLCPTVPPPLPSGMLWRYDGRLSRARTVSAQCLARVMVDLAQQYALPALDERCNLMSIAQASDQPGYRSSGIAGAWPLAARVALGDFEGAARAFGSNPYSLGADKGRFEAGKAWLLGKGVAVASVNWSNAEADRPYSPLDHAWLTGELLP